MKAPRFWYPPPHETSLLPEILSPLSVGFRAGTWVRRMLASPYRSHVPVICVGNVVRAGRARRQPVWPWRKF